ncbi:protein TASOR [Pagrus major]|uniref:protein TASOR n=1 Tax=Pagrus major TaxID=143350 RepID=UPI003CC86080
MDDNLARRRRVSAAAAAAELGANVSPQDGEVMDVNSPRESLPGPGRAGAAAAAFAARMERRNSVPGHQRHMPIELLKMTIPRKNKENKALFHYVSTESREYEDMMTILTSSYLDTSSAGCFTYCQPRLVQSELLEKEFVEKRREMKSDGRTEKELEESYCFLLADNNKLHWLCEKGLLVGQSRTTVLGNPNKGVYLSRYSDLLQTNVFTPGATGEILIFKVMKGKVKSMYENMKNLQDPTPRFDSHISKNASKVTSLTSYRAFDLTQHYFYEYTFDELRQRPRQVCPYAVLAFQFKGKDSALTSKPLAPIRLNSQSAEGSKEPAQFTVWTGDLVKHDTVLYQISLRSFSPPSLPHKLPEKLEIGWLMRLEKVTKLLPAELFSYNLYNGSQEVENNSHFCSLLEVTDRNRATTSVTGLLQELEIKRVVLVTPLTERGFLFLLSSVQMATPTERGESWKRCLQALFVFPQSRDVTKSTTRAPSSHDASESLMSAGKVMPRLTQFIPALHHALVKARANPPLELSAGVEHQAREYLTGLNEGKVRQYPMGNYESNLDEEGKPFPPPKHHRVNMEGYLNSYLYNPALYLLSVARASVMVEAFCGPEEPQEVRLRQSCGVQREATGKEVTSNSRDGQTNTQKIQQLIDLVQTCKRNAENEMTREEGGGGVGISSGRKRRLEQETAERAIKFLKASQEPGRHGKIPVDGNQVPASPGSLASVISLIGLRDVDLREDGSELAAKLLSLLTALIQTARETAVQEEVQKESSPFDKLATKLGLPTNCDIDLRKHDDLEEQMAGSVSSLEGFSPGSHSGEMNHHGAAGRGGGGGGGGGGGLGRRAVGYEEEVEQWEIPWVLIPITGLCSERYTQRDRNIPQDPRFQHLTPATSITTTTKPPRMSPTLSPETSLPPSPFLCSSPEPSPPASPSQCPSPDPSPPPSPSQCPSPEPSPPASPSQCPSPEPSPPPSPSQCPSPQPSPPASPSQCPSPQLSHPPSPSRCQPPEPNELSSFNKDLRGANEELLAPAAFREFTGVSQDREEQPQGKEKKNKEPSISASIQPPIPPAPDSRTHHSLPPTEQEKEDAGVEVMEVEAAPLEEEKETRPVEKLQRQEEAEVVEMMHVVGSDEEQKGEAKELLGGSLFSVTSPPPRPLRHIDNIVDKHLGDFASEMQLVLQEERVHYSFPQSPHSTSNTDTAALQHTLPHTPISQFSQYVSFYNPCPPVQDYVSSLQDSINSMLTELGDSWPSHKPAPSGTNIDAALANTVSAFVSSIRAANLKTGVDDSDGEVTAADVGQTPALSREDEVWQPHSVNNQLPDPTDSRNPHVATSASGSLYKPTNTAVLHSPPDMSPQSNWNPQQSRTLEISRTVTPNTRQTQNDSITRTVHYTPGAEGGSSVSGSVEVTLPGFSGVSKPLTEASHSTEVSSLASVSVTAPAADLSSLISQLQPDVFNNLVEIIKDVKRNSLQFYLHSAERKDRVHEDIKEHLLKQGNVEQSPVAFLNQENSDSRLLVIIKNKEIAGHVHKIPGLVSLKRHPSVVFVGIDTHDDIRNNSYNELFVSGGCIVSDELVLNPDFMSHDRLTSLLMILEQHNSPESVWRWKVHHKTHKKLKEQSRFRRDAANLLDVLAAYQKRHIVEFLPYHQCDMNHQSPDLNCLMELQARYTQYRHTVLLTDQFEKFPAYSSCGIIVATIEDILHDFTRLVGYHQGDKNSQPIIDDMLSPKGLGRQLSHSDSVSEHSPSIFPEHIHPLSSRDQPQHLLNQSGSGLPPLSHLSDQLVPDTSCKEGGPQPSGKDLEDLRLAISQLRAERQAQLQQQQRLDSQAELSINPLKSLLPNPVSAGSRHTTPPLRPTESAPLNPGKKAVAATLEFIHSALQTELEDELRETGAEGRRPRGRRDQRDGTLVRTVGSLGGNLGPSKSDTSTASSNPNTAAVTEPSNQSDSTNDRREKADQHGPAYSSTNACPAEGDRSRDTQVGPDQPVRAEGAPPANSTLGTAIGTKVTGSITAVTDQKDNPNPAVPRLLHIQLPQQHRQHLNHHQQQQQHLQQSHSHLQPPPHSQQRGTSLLQPPHLPHLHNQHFSHGPLLGPLTTLGGGLLGPTPVWPGAMGPTGAPALVWGYPAARDFTGSRLMGGYHNPAGQGSNMYRGGQRGGGFNGM